MSSCGTDFAKAFRAANSEFLSDMSNAPSRRRLLCPRLVVTSTRAFPGCWNTGEYGFLLMLTLLIAEEGRSICSPSTPSTTIETPCAPCDAGEMNLPITARTSSEAIGRSRSQASSTLVVAASLTDVESLSVDSASTVTSSSRALTRSLILNGFGGWAPTVSTFSYVSNPLISTFKT